MLIPDKMDDSPTKDRLSDIFQDKWRTELPSTPQIDKGSVGVELSRDTQNQLWEIPFELSKNDIQTFMLEWLSRRPLWSQDTFYPFHLYPLLNFL